MARITEPNKPRQMKWYKPILIGCIIVVGIIIFQLIPKCNSEVIEPLDDSIKDTIAAQKIRKDSIHSVAVKAVETVTVYVTKWRALKGQLDTLPCPDALVKVITLTDSIIQVDSVAISELKAELFVSDLIIANQDSVIVRDLVKIASQEKKIQKLKFWNRFFKVTTVIAGVAAAVK